MRDREIGCETSETKRMGEELGREGGRGVR